MPPPDTQSPNFDFLARYDVAPATVAARAEPCFPVDPVTTLMKHCLYGELLARQIAARIEVYSSAEEPQAELLARMGRRGAIPREALDVSDDVPCAGNSAMHGNNGDDKPTRRRASAAG